MTNNTNGIEKFRFFVPLSFDRAAFYFFALSKIKFLGISASASVRPHKKAVKKIELEGAKEK